MSLQHSLLAFLQRAASNEKRIEARTDGSIKHVDLHGLSLPFLFHSLALPRPYLQSRHHSIICIIISHNHLASQFRLSMLNTLISLSHVQSILPRQQVPARSSTLSHPPPQDRHKQRKLRESSLQGIGKEFVHLCDAGRDTEVDCAVADFDYETAEDVRVDLFFVR